MAKGHFNVIKGEYLGLSQIDRTRAIVSGQEANIVRGTLCKLDAAGKFTPAGAADSTVINAEYFVALADGTESAVGHAGALTGLSIQQALEIETDQYTGTIPDQADVTIGAGGKFVPATTGDVVLGKASSAEEVRWVNDAVRIDHNGRNANGNNVKVVRIALSAVRAIKA